MAPMLAASLFLNFLLWVLLDKAVTAYKKAERALMDAYAESKQLPLVTVHTELLPYRQAPYPPPSPCCDHEARLTALEEAQLRFDAVLAELESSPETCDAAPVELPPGTGGWKVILE